MIFAAIVIAWACFLVPWALRRYDEATRTRSVDKVSKAMRLLGRSRDEADEPEPIAEPPPLKRPVTEPEDENRPGSEPDPQPRPSRAAARAAARRRRKVLLTLVGAAVLTGIVTIVGVIPVWSLAIPLGLVAAFLGLCRWQVSREDDAIWARRRIGADEESNSVSGEAVVSAASWVS